MYIIKGENQTVDHVESPVLFYGGEFGYCFSNFAAFSVVWRGRTWQTSEHAFQASCFDDKRIIEEIFSASSAHDALKLAIKYIDQARPTWKDDRLVKMKEICKAKLDQHPYIQKALNQTGDLLLVEDSPKDEYWGRGANWQGENHLGRVWMELREEVKKQT
jgi:ribA/ribD-fused uncharacterized protein